MKVKAFGIAAVITAMLAIGAAPAMAVTNDNQLGGPPSTLFTADSTLCPAGEAVTGVVGFTRIIGGFISIVAVATVQCTGGSPGSTMGSGSGTAGSTTCPAGQVAVGITGREGDFIDLLQLRCRNADGSGPITTSVGMFGGGLGGPDGPYDCPLGMVLTGLQGQSVPGSILGASGSTIRYVEIVCGFSLAGVPFAPGGGSFVIGDQNVVIGNSVTFWGAQWAKDNSLSGGSAPHSFKGFAENPTAPSCGAGWSADTGNSTPPPDGPLPAFMAVIVTSSTDQSGSTISGNTVQIVIVQTDPGYAPNPGHAGTGTVLAVFC